MQSAKEAIDRLREGNRRFAEGNESLHSIADPKKRKTLIERQDPFAIILGCSDSRAPAEILFDHGLGDLFVIRVAGNIVAPSQIGSIEFAAERFGTSLVVVLGHSKCGAIQATLEELAQPRENRSSNLRSIVKRISPSVEPLLQTDLRNNPAELMRKAVRANVIASVENLQSGSPILTELVEQDKLQIIGAEYSFDSGLVDFYEEP
jgi:carbonic anhydrase